MTRLQNKGLPWIAVPAAVSITPVTWHISHVPLQLDGMSSIISPEIILTGCGTEFQRHQVIRTAQLLPEYFGPDLLCARCAFPDLSIPVGWMLEELPRQPDYLLLSTPSRRYLATLDFNKRGIRTGYSTSGRFLGEEWDTRRKKYNGRGWKQALVDDAVAHLQEVLR